jgi:hypothetical protein
VEPEEMDALVTRCGLSVDSNVVAVELSRRYLVAANGRTWGKIFPLAGIAHARARS